MPLVHEFSIAEALAGQVRRHARPGARIRDVEVVVGALRAIEPEALAMCWQAVTLGSELEGATLSLDQRPWSLHCRACGRDWTAAVPFETCTCGNTAPDPRGTDELDLVAITIEEDDESAEDGAPGVGAAEAVPAAPAPATEPMERGRP
jgi:hydrogenase nickel incorporation protein HypA/HybF